MKKILLNISIGITIAILSVLFVQCSKGHKSNAEYIWIPQTGSYVADSRAIDTLVMNNNWSDTAYAFINNAIERDFNRGKIDDKQIIKLYQKLLDESSNYSYVKVDSILKLSSVNEQELGQYSRMNKMLIADYKAKRKIDSSIRNDAQLSEKSNKLIDAYYSIKRKCNWTFEQAVTQPPYSSYNQITAQEQEASIKKHAYWSTHFKNNTNFIYAISELPQRRQKAMESYYTKTVSHFKDSVLVSPSPYSLQTNIDYYIDLVQKINSDLGKQSLQAKNATKAIVAFYKSSCKEDPSLSYEDKVSIGNNLLSQIENLVGSNQDNGLADFVLTL